MNFILGIDPGRDGAFWGLTKGGSPARWCDMPFNSSGIDEYAIKEFILQFPKDNTLIVLEKPFYSPQLRGKSGFTFGIYYGIVKGIIVGLGYKLEEVPPKRWKKHYGLISTKKNKITKDHSVKRAITLNPLFREKFTYRRNLVHRSGPKAGQKYTQIIKKDGRAEAYLIAEYGRRSFA